MERGQVKIIPLQNGRTTVPSWVSFDEHGRMWVLSSTASDLELTDIKVSETQRS